jgi:hypothetical protein
LSYSGVVFESFGDIMSDQSVDRFDDPPMHRRLTTMFDGRYLYYYTFGDESAGQPASSSEAEEPGDV